MIALKFKQLPVHSIFWLYDKTKNERGTCYIKIYSSKKGNAETLHYHNLTTIDKNADVVTINGKFE